ncbi:MAG: excinuclease ABC subunit UvrC [Bacteroidales bacterium]|nr:excinuclease ABC subunit UvrC [Bacteroidales bacterium]
MVQAKQNPRYDYLMSIVNILPDSPGVYRYLDAEGTIIYVGKAKNLKRRVSSYFTKEHESRRTANLVRQIYDLKYIVVNTENDALNLENRMIKQHQPKYNVLLKDGKTYPWICVRNEAFPRVFVTRTMVKDGSSYFGPYTNVSVAHALVQLFQQLYKVRTCSLNLQETMLDKGYRTCLKYHIDKCNGPCERKISRETYQENIEEIKQILRGHTAELYDTMTAHMMALAEEMRFEEAAQVKERMELIKSYRTNSNIVPSSVTDIDVFAYDEQDDSAIVSYFHIVQGAIVQSYTIEYKKRLDEPKEDVLALGILELRERFAEDMNMIVEEECEAEERPLASALSRLNTKTTELVVPFLPSVVPDGCEAFVPQRGDKRKLLELAEKNCKQYRIDQLKQADKLNPEQKQTRLLTEIKKQLGLPKLPLHIESFDNSNISGTDAVASCVVFMNGKPEKKEYRKFNIKSVVGPDDYASMHEVVMRRYRRLIDEMQDVPDLILADGGVGQMGVIRDALVALEGQYLKQQMAGEISSERMHEIHELLQIPVGGLVKDSHHRTRQMLFGNPPAAVDVKVGSELFHLLERIQEEVHRFAIKFHRDKRSKSQVHSELDDIKGIGPKTKQDLLKSFKSIKRIREASFDDLVTVVGPAKAKIIADYFGVSHET